MPAGYTGPARNLFLLGSSGTQTVTNFFESISRASTTDGVFVPDEIRYIDVNKKYVLAGSAQDSNSQSFGWLERQDYDLETGTRTEDYSTKIVSTSFGTNTTLRAMELDSNDDLIVVGKNGNIPWIAKYSNAGTLQWTSTSSSASVEYTGVACDTSGSYYVCGNTPTSGSAQAFVEKYDTYGNPLWGKSALMLGRDVVLTKISANSRNEVVAVGFLEDDSADKGYIVKIDSNSGEILWDRTLERNISGYGGGAGQSNDDIAPANVKCTACYIDSADQIYVVGSIDGNPPTNNGVGEFLVKYSPEGNMIWQRENSTSHFTLTDGAPNMIPYDVKADSNTGQTVVLSVEDRGSFALNDSNIFISKYSRNGRLVFRRKISKGNDNLGAASLDADPSFYYFIFRDKQLDGLAGEPDRYTFGKVSTSGNGLGDFEYDDGTPTLIDYTVVSNAESKIGRLSDGSVRNDTSDLITYPFTANKIVFDDLATPVANKRRQMDGPDSFEYSGSPAIRPADFQMLNLIPGNVTGTGEDLVYNGSMGQDSNPEIDAFDGWTAGNNAILANETGYMQSSRRALSIQNNGQVNGYAWQSIYTEPGKSYEVYVMVIVDLGESATEFKTTNIRVGTTINGNDLLNVTGLDPGVSNELGSGTFTATTYQTYISLMGEDPDTSSRIIVDYVIVREKGWADSSGNGRDTGIIGGDATAGGQYWNSGNGSSNSIRPPITVEELGNTFSVEAWVRHDGTPSYGNLAYIFNADYSEGNTNWGICIRSSGWLSKMDNNDTQTILATSSEFIENQWNHIIMTHTLASGSPQGNNATSDYVVYLNGVQQFSGQDDYDNANAFGTLIVGNKTNPVIGSGFSGDIGSIRVYDRVLTETEAYQNYNAGLTEFYNEAPNTAPKISSDAIVYDSNLILNYDFGNRATYDRAENLIRSSEDYTNNNFWIQGGTQGQTVLSLSDIVSPFGTKNVYLHNDDATGGDGKALDENITITPSATQQYTMSVYAKQGSSPKFDVYGFFTGSSTKGTRLSFVWDTKEVFTNGSDGGGADAVASGYEEVGNGWVRVWMTVVDSNDGTNGTLQYRLYPGSRDSGAAGTTYFWGSQMERGSLGRYIKTVGVSITPLTKVKNLSSNSFPGTINGAIFNSAGYFEFDGTDDYIQSSSVMAPGSADFSVILWYKITSTSGRGGLFERAAASPFSGWVLGQGGTNNWGCSVRDASNNNATFEYTYPTVGDWNCDAFTWNVSTQTLTPYRNGANAGTATNSGTVGSLDGNTRYPMVIAGRLDSNLAQYKPMECGEVQMYSRVLTAAEVLQNFNATRAKYGL